MFTRGAQASDLQPVSGKPFVQAVLRGCAPPWRLVDQRCYLLVCVVVRLRKAVRAPSSSCFPPCMPCPPLSLPRRDPKLYAAVEVTLQHAGNAKRAGDLYASRSIASKVGTLFKGLKGVENVYTQHTPLLSATLALLAADKLDVGAYPYMAGSQVGAIRAFLLEKGQEGGVQAAWHLLQGTCWMLVLSLAWLVLVMFFGRGGQDHKASAQSTGWTCVACTCRLATSASKWLQYGDSNQVHCVGLPE